MTLFCHTVFYYALCFIVSTKYLTTHSPVFICFLYPIFVSSSRALTPTHCRHNYRRKNPRRLRASKPIRHMPSEIQYYINVSDRPGHDRLTASYGDYVRHIPCGCLCWHVVHLRWQIGKSSTKTICDYPIRLSISENIYCHLKWMI